MLNENQSYFKEKLEPCTIFFILNNVFLLPEDQVNSKTPFLIFTVLPLLIKQSTCKQHGLLSHVDVSSKGSKMTAVQKLHG